MKEEKKILVLPKSNYGQICNELLVDFIISHGISVSLLHLPELNDKPHIALEKIFTIMIASMKKRDRIKAINKAEDYFKSLPPSCR